MFRKSITDIQLQGDHILVSRKMNISVEEAENQIALLDYSGVGRGKNPKVEKAKLPAFALAFYYHLFSIRSVPTEAELFDRYISLSGKCTGDEVMIEAESYSTEGLRARLLRTYPSLIRDFHLYLLLKESAQLGNVTYSLRKDYYEGLDLSVVYGTTTYHLSIFLQTRRSLSFKEKKAYRHDYSGVKEIQIPLSFESMRKLGSIYVCTPMHVQAILEKIEGAQRQ